MTSLRLLCSIGLLSIISLLPVNAHAQEGTEGELVALVQNEQGLNENERLYELFDFMWAWYMEQYPEFATSTGYSGQNDRWTDYSLDAIERRRQQPQHFLEVLASIDRDALDKRAKLDYELVRKALEDEIEGQRFRGEYMRINQMGGVQQGVARVIAIMPARTVEEYHDIIARLRGVPRLIDQTIILLEKGREAGLTPPRITLRKVPQQIQNLMVDDASASPMLAAFQRFPETVSSEQRERLREEATQVMTEEVYPGYRKLREYLVETYIPDARTSVGLSALPEGERWYAYNVRQSTTTDLTPQQIHEIGLREVQRIREEMEEIKRETGFEGSLTEFFAFLRTDPQFFFVTPEELLRAYRDISKRADSELVKLFGTLPRLPYGVKPVPAYAEQSQTTAYYEAGSLEAGRPGYFFANTYDLKSRPKWEMEALTLHEAVPGHHLQIALAQEQPEAHDLRKYQFYTAFVEGWGLYAESLGAEMGFYQDPYAKFGQLTYEMWRAIRLVVDTGIHALGWSRQQAIDFFEANAGKAEHDIVIEVDRYIVWPGQALAYKLGELKITELREYAEEDLGPAFNGREFHDAVLENGALPLDRLEARTRAWVEDQKEGS